jgi:glycosyltransferase involved in cell wall biosynthesis
VYVFSLRHGTRMLRYPAVLLYPAGFALSPLLAPSLRRLVLGVASVLGRQKYVVRLWLSKLKTRRVRLLSSKPLPRQEGVPVLYISYDGMLEPLGGSQVISYLKPLARTHPFTLLSYEKNHDLRKRQQVRELTQELQSVGIRWIPLRYHRRPSLLATAWDVLRGITVGFVLCRRKGIRIVHARGYVPSVMALWLKLSCGAKFLFDMRGFWPEEKVDAGHWRRGALAYRLAKRWERKFFEQADTIVSLTHAGVQAFPSLGYRIPHTTQIAVIPTCADLSRFAPGPKDPRLIERFDLRGQVVLGCTGTLSNWYLRMPTLEYLAFLVGRLAQAKVLLVTQEDHAALARDARAAGIPPAQLVLARADFSDMPAYLRMMDLGVFFITPSFSKRGSAATKLAEFLATGVPVVINDGVGDSGWIVRKHGVGVVLADVTRADFEASVDPITHLLADPLREDRCRQVAQQYFDLDVGVRNYLDLYRRLGGIDSSGLESTANVLDEVPPPNRRLEPALAQSAQEVERG